MNRYVYALFVLTLIFFSTGFARYNRLKINGVWKIVEVKTVRNGKTITLVNPRESQVVFTQNIYSFCWTSHTSQLRSWSLPDTVKLSRFNQSIVNTGSFELEDSILITKATFAMQPMFVNGEARFKCSFAGDTLILTGTSVMSAENIANPVYANGSYFVTKLIKTRNIK